MRRLELAGWLAVAIVLTALAIPWFLWGSGAVVAGLPVWLWWHVGWMLLASVVFWVFTERAWGIGIESGDRGRRGSSEGPSSASRAQTRSGGDSP